MMGDEPAPGNLDHTLAEPPGGFSIEDRLLRAERQRDAAEQELRQLRAVLAGRLPRQAARIPAAATAAGRGAPPATAAAAAATQPEPAADPPAADDGYFSAMARFMPAAATDAMSAASGVAMSAASDALQYATGAADEGAAQPDSDGGAGAGSGSDEIVWCRFEEMVARQGARPRKCLCLCKTRSVDVRQQPHCDVASHAMLPDWPN